MRSSQYNQIYVGDLPVAIDEGFLRQLFADCGAIVPNGIILKKHKTLEKSFAFITFETHDGAARAIKYVNYTKLDGVPIRISWSDPETKKIRNSGLRGIIIRGLDESIEVGQLDEAFSNFGEVIFCDIPLDENGRSCGCGIVQFRNPADAEKARVDLQDASINGKPIIIEPYIKLTKINPEEYFTNVFIKAEGRDAKLPYKNDEELSKVFEPFGEIQDVKLILDENYGFCDFKRSEDAVSAFKVLDGIELDGVKITAYTPWEWEKYEKEYQEKIKERKIFVKNFGLDVTEKEFEEFFKKFGEVEKFKIARSPQEPFESKGFGFVRCIGFLITYFFLELHKKNYC